MRSQFLAAVLAALTFPAAHAEIFKCVDAQGHVTYTNDASAARGCVRLEEDLPVSSVPSAAPKRPAAPPPAAAPSGFPRVSPADQKARDEGRREILGRELETEEKALVAARKALEEQEAVRLGDERNYQKKLDRLQPYKDEVLLHERNIEALRKEIANLR